MYACSTWYDISHGKGFKTRYKTILQSLQAFQKQTLATISGAIKLTSVAALCAELGCLPIELELRKTIGNTLNRIRASPVYEEILYIRNSVQLPRRRKHKNWNSPLRKAEEAIGHASYPIEPNNPFTVEPWWDRPRWFIASNEEQATKQHDQVERKAASKGWAILYSDGSEIENEFGSAAVYPAMKKQGTIYMGSNQ
ncbi:MAG: hypothetical protein L6R37_008472, partial [Teloschistes peruensis]